MTSETFFVAPSDLEREVVFLLVVLLVVERFFVVGMTTPPSIVRHPLPTRAGRAKNVGVESHSTPW
jgi:hypothetical protein